jgi:hypothetical protein
MGKEMCKKPRMETGGRDLNMEDDHANLSNLPNQHHLISETRLHVLEKKKNDKYKPVPKPLNLQ